MDNGLTYIEQDIYNYVSSFLSQYVQFNSTNVVIDQTIGVYVGGDINCSGPLILENTAEVAVATLSNLGPSDIIELNTGLIQEIDSSIGDYYTEAEDGKVINSIEEEINTSVTRTIKNSIKINVDGNQTIILNVSGDFTSDRCEFRNSTVVNVVSLQITETVMKVLLNSDEFNKLIEDDDTSDDDTSDDDGENNNNFILYGASLFVIIIVISIILFLFTRKKKRKS